MHRMNREDVIELLDKDDDTLEKYCSDPDEPVMSGSDDEFSNLEQEKVDDTTCSRHNVFVSLSVCVENYDTCSLYVSYIGSPIRRH